jgi:hypothetical protein
MNRRSCFFEYFPDQAEMDRANLYRDAIYDENNRLTEARDDIENKVLKLLRKILRKNPEGAAAKLKRLTKKFELVSDTLNWRRFSMFNMRRARMNIPFRIFVTTAGTQSENLMEGDRHFFGMALI